MGNRSNAKDGERFEAYLKALARDGKVDGEECTYERFELKRFGDLESESCAVEVGVGASGDPLFMFEVSVYGDKAARLLGFLRELDDDEEDAPPGGGLHS